MNPFTSPHDYETYIYTLKQQYPIVQRSTMVVVPRGRRVTVVSGELFFEQGYRLTVRERISWETDVAIIESYSYDLWRNADKIARYDPQPHPDDPTLASTHLHHKHVPPDIKHHRIPAPALSFEQPNLPTLIQEIEALIAAGL